METDREAYINPTEPELSRKDDIFDLNKIPLEVLDKGWKRYSPYLLMRDHRHPLSNHLFVDIETMRSILISSFPISEDQCKIINGKHGKTMAVLISHLDNNLEEIEDIMEQKGFYRIHPTDENLIIDSKNRGWLDMRFKAVSLYDVSSEVYERYRYLYHLAPFYRGHEVLSGGIWVKNSNPDYDYFKTRAVYHGSTRTFFSETEMTFEDKQRLVDSLYNQAILRGWSPSPDYLLFTYDLNLLKQNGVRFVQDPDSYKGIVTDLGSVVTNDCIVKTEKIAAHAGYNDGWGWGIWGNKNKKIKKLTKKEIQHFKKGSKIVPGKYKVGNFFYDPQDNVLYGVSSLLLKVKNLEKSVWPVKVSKSHQKIWNEGLKKQEDNPQEKSYFKGAYEDALRGFVSYDSYTGTFEIHVGDWIHQHPECIEKVIQRFNLSGCPVHTFIDRRLCRT